MKKYKLLPMLQIISNAGGLVTFFDKIKKFDMDVAGQKDFELVVDKKDYDDNKDVLTWGNFVAVRAEDEGDYGWTNQMDKSPLDNAGMITRIKYSNVSNEVVLKGPTLRGILSHRIITPPANADYYQLSPTDYIDDAMQNVLIDAERRSKCTKNDAMLIQIFRNTNVQVGQTYYFDRYCTYLDGIEKLLNEHDLKLYTWLRREPDMRQQATTEGYKFNYYIWPGPVNDLSAEMLTPYMPGINYELEVGHSNGTGGDGVNLITGLGQGELAARTTAKYTTLNNLYNKPFVWDAIRQNLNVAPLNLHEEAYDYSNAESYTFLSRATRDKLQGYINTNYEYSISIDPQRFEYMLEINDRIGIYDNVFKLSLYALVTNKIYRIENNMATVEYTLENIDQ